MLIVLYVFSQDEVKTIVKKVTDCEYVLKRRQLEVVDFQSYLKYGITLDKLMSARIKRAVANTAKVSKDLNDMLFAIQKTLDNHIIYIFDRSVRRFPNEVTLWNDYIAFLQAKDNTASLNAVFGKALSLYPKNEDFWLQASIHELEANSNVHSARVTLQRALRAIPASAKLWLRYFELELWNALRATERQKVLEIQEDYEALQGAPMVVFRHALAAVTDIRAILEIYAACETVGGDFAQSMKQILIEKYGHRVEVWEYLATSALSQMVVKTDVTSEETSEEAPKGAQKRKLSDASADEGTSSAAVQRVETAVSAIAEGLTQSSAVLTEGMKFTPLAESAEPVLDRAAYARMAVLCLHRAVTQAEDILGEVEAGALAQWVASAAASFASASGAATVPTTASKRKKGGKKTDGEIGEAVVATVAPVSSAAQKLQEALKNVLTQLDELASTGVQDKTSAPSVLASHSQAVRFAVHQVCSEILRAGALSVFSAMQKESNVLNAAQLAAWVTSTAPQVSALVHRDYRCQQASSTKNITAAEIVDAWCVPASALLESLESSRTAGATATIPEVQALLRALLTATPALVVTSSGCDLTKDIFAEARATALQTADNALLSAVTSALQSVIVGTQTLISSADRCGWAVYYLALQAPAADANASDRFHLLSEGYAWVDSVVTSKPHLFHGEDLQEFYSEVLSTAQDCVTSASAISMSAEDKKILEFQQAVAERALVACPRAAEFWHQLEQVQQRRGDLKAATHTRWRRDKALGSA
jgi:hypothetical protein